VATPTPNDPQETVVPQNQTVIENTPTWMPPAEPDRGQFGKYEIIGEIARGGVGVVYKARQKELDRVVALKVLQGGTAASPERVKRFMQEAQAAAKLQHPNIVPIHDFGTHGGEYFFTMDLIDGESLADLIARGPIQPKEALDIIRQVAEALQHAHENGIIHRDIKPGNILLDKSGNVKVTDFGLAKEVDRDQMHLTVTGQVMGTPRYMSPEQASGNTAQADQRSDIFSLGATLYEMLTGKPTFESDNVIEILRKICTEEPVPPHKLNPKIHRDIETICLQALEKPPERRYQSAAEMTADIQRFFDGEPIEAKPIGIVERIARRLRKHGKVIAINAGLLTVAAYFIFFYLTNRPGYLRLQIDPADADVALDGSLLETNQLDADIKLRPGAHRLHVELEPFYEPQTFTWELKPGETRTLPVGLARRTGTLNITTDPPDAAVTVVRPDGSKMPLRGPSIQLDLPTGTYGILVYRENFLSRRVTTELASQQTNRQDFALSPITLWSQPTGGNVLSVPVVADCDGDGFPDLVAGDDDGKVYCLSGRSGVPLWVVQTPGAVQSPLAAGDLNGAGSTEILFGCSDGKLYCINGRTGIQQWSHATNGPILGPTLLHDVNSDGTLDAIFGSADGWVRAVSGNDGKELWKHQTKGKIESCLAWIRQDAQPVLLAGSSDGRLCVLNPGTGELLWEVNTGKPLLFPLRIEDIHRDGKLTALLPTPKSPADARTHTAVSLDERKVTGVSDTFPRWLDLDGDGQPEKIVVAEDSTTCFKADSTNVLWKSDFPAAAASFADMDGDGWLDFVFNNGSEELICLSGRDGASLGRITLDAGTGRGYTLEDMDRNGLPDICTGAGRRLYCFSLFGGRKEWMAKAEAYYDAPFAATAGKLITKTVDGGLACYDPQNSTPLWRVTTNTQPSPYPGLAATQGLAFDTDAGSRYLCAYSADTGKWVWRAKLGGETNLPIAPPAVQGDCVVVGDGNKYVYCFGLTNGVLRWQQPASKVLTPAGIGNDSMFVSSGENLLYNLARADGQERWKGRMSDPLASAPLVLDVNDDGVEDAVGVCLNGVVYAVNGQAGQIIWEYKYAPSRVLSQNGIVRAGKDSMKGILATVTGNVICLDLKTGATVWTMALKESIMSAPAVAEINGDGVPDVVVGTMGRRVYCLSGKDGERLWCYEVGGQIRYSAPLIVAAATNEAPLVFIGTGPPENGLYCLTTSAPRTKNRGWLSPWKETSATSAVR
jgi:outer membrane protein assembly factor BamB/predicted Ser/Thr protein kinase